MTFKNFINGIMAGILISIGGAVFLSQVSTLKYVGAVFFCVALLCICAKGYGLFTGKVGYLAESCKKADLDGTFMALLGNAVGTVGVGLLVKVFMTNLRDAATAICNAKLEQSFGSALFRSVMCGILMYLAVSLYREKNTTLGIFFCVPTFILAGFEHSIADMFYFSASQIVSWQAFGYLWIIILGNAIGGVLLPLLRRLSDAFIKQS